MGIDNSTDVENVLFIFTDQQRKDSIAAYGNEFVETPNLDRLADEGVAFDRAYTSTAICSPSRASVITGERPFKNGMTRNTEQDIKIKDNCQFYSQLLRDAGYNVGLTGKWHIGDHPREFGFDGKYYPGWWQPLKHEDYLAYLDEQGFSQFDGTALGDVFPKSDPSYESGGIDDRPIEASFTHFLTERAIERLNGYAAKSHEQPFYHSVHYFGPHDPYYLPKKYFHMYEPSEIPLPESAIRETFENKPQSHRVQRLDHLDTDDWRRIIAAYHGWVTFIDKQVGRLIETLKHHNLLKTTAIFYTTDHGGFVTAHKLHDKGPAMYEDIYNVPLIVSGIGREEQRMNEHLVSLLDLPPTFLDIANVETPSRYDGRSLFGLQDGKQDWREAITAEFHGHKFAYEQRMICTDRYKLVLNEADTPELYDLEADPHELTNRINDPEYGSIAQRLYEQLEEKLTADEDQLPPKTKTKISNVSDVWSE